MIPTLTLQLQLLFSLTLDFTIENIIFENPLRRIFIRKKSKIRYPLKRIQASFQHSVNNVPPIHIHRVINWKRASLVL
jgi:hypothetical protein